MCTPVSSFSMRFTVFHCNAQQEIYGKANTIYDLIIKFISVVVYWVILWCYIITITISKVVNQLLYTVTDTSKGPLAELSLNGNPRWQHQATWLVNTMHRQKRHWKYSSCLDASSRELPLSYCWLNFPREMLLHSSSLAGAFVLHFYLCSHRKQHQNPPTNTAAGRTISKFQQLLSPQVIERVWWAR